MISNKNNIIIIAQEKIRFKTVEIKMLYSNTKLNANEVKADFGNFFRVTLGEYGRGRKALNLTCPEGFNISEKQLLDEYSIGLTKSGKPRISKISDSDMYLMISSQYGYTRRGNGSNNFFSCNFSIFRFCFCNVLCVLHLHFRNFEKMSFEILTFFVSIFGIYFFVESMFYLADHCISTTIFNSKTDIVLIFIAMFAMCFLGYQIYQMADIIRY